MHAGAIAPGKRTAAKRGHHRLFSFGPRKRGVRPHPPNPPWLRACTHRFFFLNQPHTSNNLKLAHNLCSHILPFLLSCFVCQNCDSIIMDIVTITQNFTDTLEILLLKVSRPRPIFRIKKKIIGSHQSDHDMIFRTEGGINAQC